MKSEIAITTVKELADKLHKPIPYINSFINVASDLGLCKEVKLGKTGTKAKNYEVPKNWVTGEKESNNQKEELNDDLYYDPSMDIDMMGDPMREYLDERASKCDMSVIESYTNGHFDILPAMNDRDS